MFKRPQVLMIGNGLNLAYGGVSWGDLLKDISVRTDIPDDLRCPMPLKAMLYTNNDLKTAMNKKKNHLYGKVTNNLQRNVLQQILTAGFDDILTTNYSYELEMSALGLSEIKESQLKKLAEHTPKVGRVESKYLLHSYHRADIGNKKNRIWHIHGEARKPDSMIIGHYYYANLLGKMIAYIASNENRYEINSKNDAEIEFNSWLDSFILGDVYVLGFRFDVSEFDLWWLLNRKLREKAPHGKVFFFEPYVEEFSERIELLKLLDVEYIDCGVQKPDKNDPNCSAIYQDFYRKALARIEKAKDSKKLIAVGG